jgi:hypothetical protein
MTGFATAPPRLNTYLKEMSHERKEPGEGREAPDVNPKLGTDDARNICAAVRCPCWKFKPEC